MIQDQFKNIASGAVFKNYKELCQAIGEEPKAGDSKVKQLREIEEWLKLRKDGWKYIVEEVYEKRILNVSNIEETPKRLKPPKRGRPTKKEAAKRRREERTQMIEEPVKTDKIPIARLKIGQQFKSEDSFYDFINIDRHKLTSEEKKQIKKAVGASVEWKKDEDGIIEITDIRLYYPIFSYQNQSIPNFLFLKPGDEVALYFCKTAKDPEAHRAARKGIVKEIFYNGNIAVEIEPIVPEEPTTWIFAPNCWSTELPSVHLYFCTPDFETNYKLGEEQYLTWYAVNIIPEILKNRGKNFLKDVYSGFLKVLESERERIKRQYE